MLGKPFTCLLINVFP